jgi:hypothetical protein
LQRETHKLIKFNKAEALFNISTSDTSHSIGFLYLSVHFAAKRHKEATNNNVTDMAICHKGTPNGIRISITIGEVSGIMEKTTAIVPWGSLITVKNNINTQH